MKLTFLSIGKDRSGLFSPGVDEYAKRLTHTHKVQLVELPESRASGVKAKEEEGAALLKKLGPRDALVALDEHGKSLSSVDFAKWLGRQQDSGRDVAFVIGGDEGLSEEVRAKAALTLSLSAMTLPHRLARLVLLEQVYRAFSILRGEPYHKV
ncbi:MAG: 23S rRNA (pseudouridine(1915)-N(3))-methyltransferase RlmH [Archangium gephyra]|uniref:Ribosomal RNA large subunit methyltransferase H n=1 Tax=Archangium gephyra TaxID=48 RepID=A0A2W5SUX8_9BACT|nr:MAG: 23S rRNA (pseudouridine(1915)-N(3))-methyltransferase RlmH [Archangium gephyra]